MIDSGVFGWRVGVRGVDSGGQVLGRSVVAMLTSYVFERVSAASTLC